MTNNRKADYLYPLLLWLISTVAICPTLVFIYLAITDPQHFHFNDLDIPKAYGNYIGIGVVLTLPALALVFLVWYFFSKKAFPLMTNKIILGLVATIVSWITINLAIGWNFAVPALVYSMGYLILSPFLKYTRSVDGL